MQSAELFLPTVHGLVEKLLISTMQCCYRLCVIERTCIPQTYYISVIIECTTLNCAVLQHINYKIHYSALLQCNVLYCSDSSR